MATLGKRYPRSTSSIKNCQEKFACDGECVEGVFECDNCGTFQCSLCEYQIHSNLKYMHHDRRKINKASDKILCQSTTCVNKYFAEVICEQCELRYCLGCYDKSHNTPPRKFHRKVKFSLDHAHKTDTKAGVKGLEILAKPNNSIENISAIQPSSPVDLGNGNESLTYFSMPQTDNGIMDAKTAKHITTMSSAASKEGAPKIKTFADVDLFVEDPSFQDSPIQTNIPSSQEQNTAKYSQYEEVGTFSGNEDSEPESSRHSSFSVDDEIFKDCRSFLLADQNEVVKVKNEEDFLEQLQCDDDSPVKVVSIFGNTGDGKSHTLNHTFFGAREVFLTSSSPSSCTTGVWAALDPVHNALIVDTEGLLGVSPNQNQRTRLLLKVLAISDIVVYRSRAERLHNDLFQFLADASNAYTKHFTAELKNASSRNKLDVPLSSLGPAVLVFHETHHTDVLKTNSAESADEMLRKRFHDLGLCVDAFNCIHYIGTQTTTAATDFKGLLLSVKNKLRDTSVRSARRPSVIYRALQLLNDKFSGEIEKSLPETFPDQYFTCQDHCLSCNCRCNQGMNHKQEQIGHKSDKRCCYRHEYQNKLYLCKTCFNRGQEMEVVPKTSSSKDKSWMGLVSYAWSGYVLECPQCGIIYRSRQFWYGNKDPDTASVQTEIRHVWPGSNTVLQGTHNAARRLLDGINYMSDTLASVGAKPTKMVTDWISDQIAPPYWVPNSQITKCKDCTDKLEHISDIHHCRACGQGFCDNCSSQRRRVPERGWGDMEVRVCDQCYSTQEGDSATHEHTEDSKILPRKVGEAIGSTVGTVASLINYPLDMLQNSARPTYWIPDSEIVNCCCCSRDFGPKCKIHHCRSCGQGVCDLCSKKSRAVPSRGWDYLVRVCDNCDRKHGEL